MSPYITHNHWFLLFFVAAPLIIFCGWRSVMFGVLRCGIAILAGWALIHFAVDRHWDLRIAFLPANATEQQAMDATADGASRVFYLILGWVPAGFYAMFWFLLWLPFWWFMSRRGKSPNQRLQLTGSARDVESSVVDSLSARG